MDVKNGKYESARNFFCKLCVFKACVVQRTTCCQQSMHAFHEVKQEKVIWQHKICFPSFFIISL